MYSYLYNYAKPKYKKKANLCHVDTDSLIVHVKSEEIYADLAGDAKKGFFLSPSIKSKQHYP